MRENKKFQIILFTLSYPYKIGAENTFIENEIRYLTNNFNKVTVIPSKIEGEAYNFESLDFNVDKSFVKYQSGFTNNKLRYIYRAFHSKYFYKELILSKAKILKSIKRKLIYLAKALFYVDVLKKYLIESNNNISTIIYTFWSTEITLAAAILKKSQPNAFFLISRAHGIDLYEERGYVHYRNLALEQIDMMALASNAGLNYMYKKYPSFKRKLKLYPIHLNSANKISKVSESNSLSIISCSSIDKIKRVDLIFKAMVILAKKYKNVSFIWNHFGEGVLKDKLYLSIAENKVENLQCFLHGKVENDTILRFYEIEKVDIFVTTSYSEGGRPLSIQEAMNHGVPIIATEAGGIKDIVNDFTGKLLALNATPKEIAAQIALIAFDKKKLKQLKYSTKKFFDKINAENSYEEFVNELKSL